MSSPTTPTFVLPYKRYAAETLLELAKSYLNNDKQSYRQTVRAGRVRIGYAADPQSCIDERSLHHMTVWRMLSWLGAQIAALQLGRRLLLEANPHSSSHRFVAAVHPQKFRSPQRHAQLEHARQVLQLGDDWHAQFGEKFFPRFATRAGPS